MITRPTDGDLFKLYRLWAHLPRVTRRIEFLSNHYGGRDQVETVCPAAEATVVTSEIKDSNLHAPVLDIDLVCSLVPSSTVGHHHLIIEKAMTWRQYRRLLKALGRAGLVEQGFVQASIRRGYSAVRVPWVKK